MPTLIATKKMGFTHDDKINQSPEWYTPAWIFEKLGLSFDLDPCSPPGGLPWIPAKNHYSVEDDGLNKPWSGRVWLNPPYGTHTPDWLAKMHRHRNGLALVFARTDCRWYHDYVIKADAILYMQGRVSFIDGGGQLKERRRGIWKHAHCLGAGIRGRINQLKNSRAFCSVARP